MKVVDLIGIRFDGYGRPGNQTAAAAALWRAGIAQPASDQFVDLGDIAPTRQSTQRGPNGLLNESALVEVKDQLSPQIRASISNGRFPLVFGGDCSALLGSVTGARDALGSCGLLHIDGHEDATPIDASPDGEAANLEIGLLLGMSGRQIDGAIGNGLPALHRDALALLGPRDDKWRRELNVGTLAASDVWKRAWEPVALDPAGAARAAVAHIRKTTPRWWMHIDIDVMDPVEFPAQGIVGFPDEPGGLTKSQLSTLVEAADAENGCVGASIAIYDPDQDPDGSGAEFTVELTRRLLRVLT